MKEEKEYPEFCTSYVYSKIYALMGATKLCMGRPDNALEFLETSLKYLKNSVSKNTRVVSKASAPSICYKVREIKIFNTFR